MSNEPFLSTISVISYLKARSQDPIFRIRPFRFRLLVACSHGQKVLLVFYIRLDIYSLESNHLCYPEHLSIHLRISILVFKCFSNLTSCVRSNLGSIESKMLQSSRLSLMLSDENRSSSICIRFLRLTDPTVGSSLYMCSHDLFFRIRQIL